MKKDKQPSPAKAARKAIQESLLKTLKSIASQLQKQGIHTEADLEKESKKLAKKITKGAKVDQPAATKATPATGAKMSGTETQNPANENASASAKKAAPAPMKEPARAKAKPVAKPSASKTIKVTAPAAAPEPPASAAAPKRVNVASKSTAEKK
jgi:hypothetical protein